MDGNYDEKSYVIDISGIPVVKQGKFNKIDDFDYKVDANKLIAYVQFYYHLNVYQVFLC